MVLISEQMDQIVIGKEQIKGWQNNVATNFAARSVSTGSAYDHFLDDSLLYTF